MPDIPALKIQIESEIKLDTVWTKRQTVWRDKVIDLILSSVYGARTEKNPIIGTDTDNTYYLYKIPVKRVSLINVQLINCLQNVKCVFLDLMHNCILHCIILMRIAVYQLCKL